MMSHTCFFFRTLLVKRKTIAEFHVFHVSRVINYTILLLHLDIGRKINVIVNNFHTRL